MEKRNVCSLRRSLIAVFVTLLVQHAFGQSTSTSSSTARAGTYTAEQATTGETAYKAQCASCHGAELEGRGPMPPLLGADFIGGWKGMSVGDLSEKIQATMPADKPGTLTPQQNAAIIAYLLKRNGYPAGAAPLPAEIAAQKKIAWGDK